jgi:CHAT domain-containing protein
MRSNLFASTLAIALGFMKPIGNAIVFPEMTVAQTVDQRKVEAYELWELGNQKFQAQQFESAIEFWNQALIIVRKVKHRKREGTILGSLGVAYKSLGNYDKSIDYQKQSLAIARETNDREGEGNALGNLGNAYNSLGNYKKAIENYEQSLVITREIKDKFSEGIFLGNLGIAHRSLGNYTKAIEFYEQNLVIVREIKDRKGEGAALGNLGSIYESLGNYTKAIEFHGQSLVINREIKDRLGEVDSLKGLGVAYSSIGKQFQAIDFHNQSLIISRDIKYALGEGHALGNLGISYFLLDDNTKAVQFHEQSLAIKRRLKDRKGEGASLANLGISYRALGNYNKAIEYLEQSLAIIREIKDRAGERIALHNLGIAFEKKEPELALVFYKQSVNITESIRQDNRKLDRTLQTSYTETVAGTYRRLADLLIAQGRIIEAQEVLELLKIQEINDSTQTTRSNTPRSKIALNQIEQEIITRYNSLAEFGKRLYDCEQTKCSQYSEYNQQYQKLFAAYNQLIEETKTKLKETRLNEVAAGTQKFLDQADTIVTAQPDSILIYPLVLEDKVRILWATKGGALDQAECPIGETQLNQLVTQFRTDLQNSTDLNPVQKTGQQLYNCLLPPKLQTVLTQAKIQNLIFVPDRITNYIPMAALHNGKNYLIEQYSVSNILAASITDTTSRLPKTPTVLGFGLSQAAQLTNPTRNFSSLPFVPYELDNIIKQNQTDRRGIFPGNQWLDRDFTRDRLSQALLDTQPNILHIATHGEFDSTDASASYLVFGDGTAYPTADIQSLRTLQNVHLVVLSACETAVGGRDRNGLEVAGIASYFLGTSTSKAKAVLASLWKVNDPATSLLMSEFYNNLNPGTSNPQGMTKTQALRQVQLKLINSQLTIQDAPNRAGARPYEPDKKRPQNLSHPYYWAPFILIGNGS